MGPLTQISTVSNKGTLVNKLTTSGGCLCSFDVVSLFTNVPLLEIVELFLQSVKLWQSRVTRKCICCRCIYRNIIFSR